MAGLLSSVDGIDPDGLRAAVGPPDRDAFADLISVKVERLAEGLGMCTDIHRLRLAYAPGARPGPASLIVKAPSSIPEVRAFTRSWGLYHREVLFYRDIASTVGLRVPKVYAAEFDPETHDFVLVMEDLAPAVEGDQTNGLPLEQVRLALEGIASLHASWWNRPELQALTDSIQPFGEGPWRGSGERLAASWPIFAPFLNGRTSATLRRIGERMPSVVDRLMTEMAREPRTLCHGDFRGGNLMFAPGDRNTSLITIDWQLAMQARGAIDVGILLGMSVTPDLRRAHEMELLRGYHDSLVAGGVTDYAFDAFFEDYRRSLLICFFYVIQSGSANDLTQPLAEALYDSAVRRLDAYAQDHGLEALVG